jgi:hypothetical protein
VDLAVPATGINWFDEDGGPARTGQPLVRLRPTGSE